MIESYQSIRDSYMLLSMGNNEILYNGQYKIHIYSWNIIITSRTITIECEINRLIIRNKRISTSPYVIYMNLQPASVHLSPERNIIANKYMAMLAQIYQVLLQYAVIIQ